MYTEQQKIKQRIANKKSYHKHKVKRLAWTREYQKSVQIEVIRHYGGECNCCGESELAFLAIDHIGGGGMRHRKEIGISGGPRFYMWIRKNKYPKNLRILCHNCNQATSWGRKCPHELLK